MAGHKQSAARECHEFGHFLLAEDMGDSLFILIVAPIVEVLLVVRRSRLWEVLDGVDGNTGLAISFTESLLSSRVSSRLAPCMAEVGPA